MLEFLGGITGGKDIKMGVRVMKETPVSHFAAVNLIIKILS